MKKISTNILKKEYFEEVEITTRIPDCYWEWSLITIEDRRVNQQWLGLGGSLTQATTINFLKLSPENRKKFIEENFLETGLNYQFIRLPIASCDFSPYSYEIELNKTISLEEDNKLILPLLKMIQNEKKVTIIASPWSPPKKWKDNNSLYGGKLLKEFYSDYADYLLNFLLAYQKELIDISYLSIQNEPFASQKWESCVWGLENQKEFIYNYLLPKLESSKINTSILLWDHNKENLYHNIKEIYQKKNPKIKAIGFHWYSGTHFEQLNLIKDEYPELLLIETEACCAFSKYNEFEWIKDAEKYLWEIIGNINHGMNAFVDWNLLLDFKGGPNHQQNYCKSPIILNDEENDFIKTPIYYYLKHISFVPINSRVLTSSIYRDDIACVCFLTPQNKKHIIILNLTNEEKEICIMFGEKLLQDLIQAHSILSYIEE